MEPIKINFENEQYLELLKLAISGYTKSRDLLLSTLERNTIQHNIALIELSIAIELYNELQRYTFRANAKYPATKSFVPHKAIIMQNALQFYQMTNGHYINNVQRILLFEVNQQLNN